MKLNKNEILREDLSYFKDVLNTHPYVINKGEHYKLLTNICKLIDNITIIDAGTHNGHSCLALAQNKTNKVITYDIMDKSFDFFKEYNIEFRKLDINKETPENIKSAEIILLDVDPHDGVQEKKFTDYLKEIGYEGYVLCDDIYLNDGMKTWWNSLEVKKYDLTDIGHFSGTGLLVYSREFEINGEENI